MTYAARQRLAIRLTSGVGKSTLYQSLQSLQGMPRVNTDEILRDFGDWRNMADVHYIGLEDVDIAKERVAMRVKQGGHGIAEKDIERRYIDTVENLKIVLPESDLAALYDNTIEFRRFAIYKNGKPIRISHSVPMWYERFIADIPGTFYFQRWV